MDKRSALFGTWAAVLLWMGDVNAQEKPTAADIAVETIELPFSTTLLKLDPTGKRVLVAGFVLDDLPDDYFTSGKAIKTELALVDLEARKILARTQVDGRLRLVHLDDRAAYVLPPEGSPLHVLSLDTLEQTRRVFMNPPVSGICTLPGGKLAVQTGGGLRGYSNETFEAVELPGCLAKEPTVGLEYWQRDFGTGSDPDVFAPAIELTDGILFNGVVLDKSGRPRFLYYCPYLQSFGAGNVFNFNGQNMVGTNARAVVPRSWGREIFKGRLTGPVASALPLLPGHAVILRDYPLAAEISFQFTTGAGIRRDSNKFSLAFYELVEGKLLADVTLIDNAVESERREASRGIVRLEAIMRDAGDRVVVAYDTTLFLASLDRERFEQTPEPVHFVYREEPFCAPAGEVASVAFEAKGGVGKKQYRLVRPVNGLSIDRHSGEVQIDTAAIWKRYLELYHSHASMPSLFEVASRDFDPRERSRKIVEQLLGRTVEEVPVAVGIHLSAVDTEGQEDQLMAQFIILGPKQDIEKQLAQAKADQEKALEEARKAQQAAEQRNAMAAQSRNDATSEQSNAAAAAAVARLDELTRQNEGLAVGIADLRVALAESKKQSEHWEQQASEDRKHRASLDERLDVLVRQTQDQQRYLRYLLVAAGVLALLVVVVLVLRVASRRASAAGG